MLFTTRLHSTNKEQSGDAGLKVVTVSQTSTWWRPYRSAASWPAAGDHTSVWLWRIRKWRPRLKEEKRIISYCCLWTWSSSGSSHEDKRETHDVILTLMMSRDHNDVFTQPESRITLITRTLNWEKSTNPHLMRMIPDCVIIVTSEDCNVYLHKIQINN